MAKIKLCSEVVVRRDTGYKTDLDSDFMDFKINSSLRATIDILLVVLIGISQLALIAHGQAFGDLCSGPGIDGCLPNSGLICNRGVCQCPLPGMVFRMQRASCVSGVGQVCDPEAVNSECVEHAECDPAINRCVCKLGYFEMAARICTDPLANSGLPMPVICCSASERVSNTRYF